MTSACLPDNLLLVFPFLFWYGKQQITRFFLSFFFLSFFKDYNKNVRDLIFYSFFLPSFLLFRSFFSLSFFFSLKITSKKIRDLTFRSFFLLVLKSACCYDCWLENLPPFFCFPNDVASKKSHDPFFLSFFLGTEAQMYTKNVTLVFYIICRCWQLQMVEIE